MNKRVFGHKRRKIGIQVYLVWQLLNQQKNGLNDRSKAAGSTIAEDSCQIYKLPINSMLISQTVLWDFNFFQRGKLTYFSCYDAKETSY